MSIRTDHALYDTFNAKFLTLEQVGKTFIPHAEFLKLAENKHSIILGPRGSGKTTFLKMLTLPALNCWEIRKPQYQALKQGLAFTAIYIPADLIWEKEIKSIENRLSKYPTFATKLINTIFNTNVFISTVKTFKDLISIRYKEFSKNTESLLVEAIAKELQLDAGTFPSLTGVIKELQSRVSEIASLISELEDSSNLEESINRPGYFNLNYLRSLTPICTTFDILYNDQKESKWALCFDELEIVPLKIVVGLFQELRNSPGQFLFKLSTCPIQSLEEQDLYGANQMDEYNVIKMWPTFVTEGKAIESESSDDDEDFHKNDYQIFCSELATARFNRLLKKKYNISEKVSLSHLLGEFDYKKTLKDYVSAINGRKFSVQLSKEPKVDDFREGGLGWLAFRELACLDLDFRQFLILNHIDPKNPFPPNDIIRTQIHRKLKQVVLNRLIFTKLKKHRSEYINRSEIEFRRRRNPTVYHGVKTLINIVDGNPRYLNGIIDELVDNVSINMLEGRAHTQIITINQQSNIIIKVAEKFLNKIKAIPLNNFPHLANQSIRNRIVHISDLVEVIGTVFQKEINIQTLVKEPHGSIYIDPISLKNPELLELIKTGINWGAFIIVNKNENERYDNLLGTRIRLAYLLAPYYKLPLRLYQPMSLNECLKTSHNLDIQIQLKLLANEDTTSTSN